MRHALVRFKKEKFFEICANDQYEPSFLIPIRSNKNNGSIIKIICCRIGIFLNYKFSEFFYEIKAIHSGTKSSDENLIQLNPCLFNNLIAKFISNMPLSFCLVNQKWNLIIDKQNRRQKCTEGPELKQRGSFGCASLLSCPRETDNFLPKIRSSLTILIAKPASEQYFDHTEVMVHRDSILTIDDDS